MGHKCFYAFISNEFLVDQVFKGLDPEVFEKRFSIYPFLLSLLQKKQRFFLRGTFFDLILGLKRSAEPCAMHVCVVYIPTLSACKVFNM